MPSPSAQAQFFGTGAMGGRVKPGPNLLTGPQIAPPTVLEHYPSHWGAAMTVAAITSCLRYSELGYRRVLVDMLAELLEGDLHAHGILRKLYGAISNRTWTVQPAEVEEEDKAKAEFIAEDVARAIAAIPRWTTHVAGMLWAHYYGTTAREIMWRRDKRGWAIARLELVHSRRISYDWDFKPFIHEADYATTGIYPEDFPAKFAVFEPIIVEDYPTRQGCGRSMAYWMGFKRFMAREMLGSGERFGKPFPVAKFRTQDDGLPRAATAEDIRSAEDVVVKIGKGSAPGAVLPDSIDLVISAAMAHSERGQSIQAAFIDLCNAEESKAILANTLTSEVGRNGGNRALGEVMERGESQLIKDLAGQFDECVTAQIVRWHVHLNYGPDAARDFCPKYVTDVNDPENLDSEAKVLETLVNLGLSVPTAEVHQRFGWREPIGDEPVLSRQAKAAPPVAEDDESEPEDNENEGADKGAPREPQEDEGKPDKEKKQTPAAPDETATKE